MVVFALNKFRSLRNNADYSPFYPSLLDRDARDTISAAQTVLLTCRRWVKLTNEMRGL